MDPNGWLRHQRAMIKQQTMTTRAWIEMFVLAAIRGGSFLAFAIALRVGPE